MPKASAFSPAGISSFFEICDRTADGAPIADLERVGARGGGFGIQKGVLTEVTVSEAKASSISVSINGVHAAEAETTRTVAEMLLHRSGKFYEVVVNHRVDVPIGAGFGSSAAGALTAALALAKALELPLTYNQIGRIAHAAEVQCRTGLGTVGPLMLGGCILTVEPGAPGISVIDRIPLSDNYAIVAGVFGAIPTRQVLASAEKRREVNRWGRKTLEAILDEPSVENFMARCLEFAEKTGFMTPRVKRLVKLAEQAGAVGVAQNMVGEAVHALALEENAAEIAEAFKQVLPNENVIIAKIDFQGARLISHETV
ncbi:MAG: pantoate kinase [Candidatus Bathyarchaeales archaeon]